MQFLTQMQMQFLTQIQMKFLTQIQMQIQKKINIAMLLLKGPLLEVNSYGMNTNMEKTLST